MAQTTSDVFVETIMAWGVDTIFGIPGDGINGVIEALRTRKEQIKFIQVRHEEAAAFMACAYAKYRAWELNGFVGPNAIISGDSGMNTT